MSNNKPFNLSFRPTTLPPLPSKESSFNYDFESEEENDEDDNDYDNKNNFNDDIKLPENENEVEQSNFGVMKPVKIFPQSQKYLTIHNLNAHMKRNVTISNVPNIPGDSPMNNDIDEFPPFEENDHMISVASQINHSTDSELTRQCGFIILLNCRMIQLQYEIKTKFPKLSKQHAIKLNELFNMDYQKLMEEKLKLEQQVAELQKQNRINKQSLEKNTSSLENERSQLQKLNQLVKNSNIGSNNLTEDSKSILTIAGLSFITELQKELNSYRDKVSDLITQLEDQKKIIAGTKSLISKTHSDLQQAQDDMKIVLNHLQYLEESHKENYAETMRSKQQLELIRREKEELKLRLQHSQTEVEVLQSSMNEIKSQSVVMKDQFEQVMQHQLQQKVREMEERLNIIQAQKLQAEDKFHQQMRIEQERGDKFRAKYESLKQLRKKLESDQQQLLQQNAQFLKIIQQLQQQLQQPQQQLQQQQQPQPQKISADVSHSQLLKGKSQQNQIQGSPLFEAAKQMTFQHKQKLNKSMNNMLSVKNINNGNHNYHNKNDVDSNSSKSYNVNDGNNNHNNDNNNQNNLSPMNNSMMNHSQRKLQNIQIANENINDNSNQNGLNPQTFQKWSRKTTVLSEKGAKKRILVEWHFITSDDEPHYVVLQHTQDTKGKTRRMLWVDDAEKYNDKSQASSFRIEIDKDVVVVSIEMINDEYQYRLTINGLNYYDALKQWQNKHSNNNVQ